MLLFEFPKWLTVEWVHGLHERLMDMDMQEAVVQRGGAAERDNGCIAGGLGNVELALGYDSAPSEFMPFRCAAYVLKAFCKLQCYVDGNKRIAWSLAIAVLQSVGLTVEAEHSEAAIFVLQASMTPDPSIEMFEEWLVARIVEHAAYDDMRSLSGWMPQWALDVAAGTVDPSGFHGATDQPNLPGDL
ncbi:MAG: Fic family protein [Planctomycetota bacterium]